MDSSNTRDSSEQEPREWMPVSVCLASGLALAALAVLHGFELLEAPTTSTASSAAYAIAAVCLLLLAWHWPRFRRADVDDFSGVLAALVLTASALWPAVFESGRLNETAVALVIVSTGMLILGIARLAPTLLGIFVVSLVALLATVQADRALLATTVLWAFAALLGLCARQWRQHSAWVTEDLKEQRLRNEQALQQHLAKMDNQTQQRQRLEKRAAALAEQLERSRRVDPLTGLANRQQFHEMLSREFRRAQREQQGISLLFCDIDGFAAYNRRAGNDAGDRLIQEIAALISATIGRPTDVIARYEGAVFAIVLPNTTVAQGRLVANRVRDFINESAIPHPASNISRHVTVSIGLSNAIPYSDLSPERLMSLAASALKDAKDQGRNRVTVEAVSPVEEIQPPSAKRRIDPAAD